MGEFIQKVDQLDPEQLSLLQAYWENELEEHLGENHTTLGLTLNPKESLIGLRGKYRMLRVYESCVPSAAAVIPGWRGFDRKIMTVLLEDSNTHRKGHLACLCSISMSLESFQADLVEMAGQMD